MRGANRSSPPGRVIRRWLASVMVVLALAACGGDDEPVYIERPVEDLYNTAMNELAAENYAEAARLFDEVERYDYALPVLSTGSFSLYFHDDPGDTVAAAWIGER